MSSLGTLIRGMRRNLFVLPVIILVMANRCVIQYTSPKQEVEGGQPDAVVMIYDTLIAVNGKPVLVRPLYSTKSLAALSGDELERAELKKSLLSLKIREETARGDSGSSDFAISIKTGLYTQFLTFYNVLAVCNVAEYTTARVYIRGNTADAELIIDRPESTDICTDNICIITENSIRLVSGNDTIFTTQYREEYVYKDPDGSGGISVPFNPRSETLPAHPKTGKTLHLSDLRDIMLYEADDTTDVSVFLRVTKNLRRFRKKSRTFFSTEPLCVIARYNIPVVKAYKLVRAAHEAGFNRIRVAMLGSDRRVK